MAIDVYEALAEQHAELDAVLSSLDDAQWSASVPACPGWDVADVVLHMAQTDEAATAAAEGQFSRFVSDAAKQRGEVDASADAAVESGRGMPNDELLERWRAASTASRNALVAVGPSARVNWVAGEMAARTLTTTRLSECWIHTGDVVEAVGRQREPVDRLWHIARLAWRTIPYAFEREREPPPGDVAVSLDAPDGTTWQFGDEAAPTRISGPALDFCLVAARRREPSQTALKAEGPAADAVLRLVRTYA